MMVDRPGPLWAARDLDQLLDRGSLRFRGSRRARTFKLVTAIAALRIDPKLTERKFTCRPLGDDGRDAADPWLVSRDSR